MTDKQIIIDGVNVRECKYFNKYQKIVRNNEVVVDIQNACIERNETVHCNRRCNCYYKNWQLKEQECERLEENISDLKKDLKFQNDKISELELDLQNAMDSYVALDLMRVGEYNALVDDYTKLKQTLTEIKEIAEANKNYKFETKDVYAGDTVELKFDVLDKILQKINEVEDDKRNN